VKSLPSVDNLQFLLVLSHIANSLKSVWRLKQPFLKILSEYLHDVALVSHELNPSLLVVKREDGVIEDVPHEYALAAVSDGTLSLLIQARRQSRYSLEDRRNQVFDALSKHFTTFDSSCMNFP
jgi:hypothetical protein